MGEPSVLLKLDMYDILCLLVKASQVLRIKYISVRCLVEKN